MLCQLAVAKPQSHTLTCFVSKVPFIMGSQLLGMGLYSYAAWQSADNGRAWLHVLFLQFSFFLKAIPLLFALLASLEAI